jgi:hypothetical protein
MNERIYELAEQAGFIPGIMGLNRFTYFDPDKFAELIVRECVKVMYDNAIERQVPPDIDKTPIHYAMAILEHFNTNPGEIS